MNLILLNLSVLIVTFFAMELIAWFTHKYIMHGLLWRLHKDHHKKESTGFFEHNDFFFLIFAVPGIIFLYLGSSNFNLLFWIGAGITLYGMAYFFVHDIFIHQRFKLFRNSKNKYLLAIRRAHKTHHKYIGKEEGECFGMLWVPMKYFRAVNAQRIL